jgi:hypothetical protein
MRTDEVDQRLPEVGIEFLGCSGDCERCRERLVLIVLQFLGDDVYTDLIILGGGYGHQDGAMTQDGCKLLEHGGSFVGSVVWGGLLPRTRSL